MVGGPAELGRLGLAHREAIHERLLPARAARRPRQTPDWMPDTRSGVGWVSAHHSPWSGGMVSRSSESLTVYVAALSARELHCGR